MNAADACITVPSVISPERYFGEHKITGITEAMTKLPCDTNIVRMYCPAIFAHMVITALVGPACDGVLGQPGAPAPLHAHAGVDDAHRDRDAARGERNEEDRLMNDNGAVLLLQRVEDRLVPDVELIRKEELGNDQQ